MGRRSAFTHLRYHCLVAGGALSQFDTYLRAERQEDINTRAELYETEMLVDVAVVIRTGVGHDAARYGTGYLAAENLLAVRRLYDDVGMFVLGSCFRKPCLMVVPIEMLG